jgi:hypothetical protein
MMNMKRMIMMVMMCRQTTTMIMMMMNLKMYPGKMKITTMIMEMITGGAGKIQEAVIHAGDLVQLDGKGHASQVARVDWNLEEAKGEEMKMINILLHDMKGEMGVALPVVVVAKLPIEIPVGTAEAFLPVIKAQATGVLRQVAAMRVLQIIAVAVIPEGHRGIHHAAIPADLNPLAQSVQIIPARLPGDQHPEEIKHQGKRKKCREWSRQVRSLTF